MICPVGSARTVSITVSHTSITAAEGAFLGQKPGRVHTTSTMALNHGKSVRVGSSFARADLIVMHPSTWLDVRSTRTTIGSYVLRQDEPMEELGETLDSFFGVRVVQNTKCPLNTAIIMDTALAVKGSREWV